jgi:hypothetical protein
MDAKDDSDPSPLIASSGGGGGGGEPAGAEETGPHIDRGEQTASADPDEKGNHPASVLDTTGGPDLKSPDESLNNPKVEAEAPRSLFTRPRRREQRELERLKPSPGAQRAACNAFDVLLAEIYVEENRRGSKFERIATHLQSVSNAIYGDKNVHHLLTLVTEGRTRSGDVAVCRWIHLPANNASTLPRDAGAVVAC